MTTENIAKGKHRAKLSSIQFGFTEKDNEQIVLGFEIVGDGPDAGRFISSFRYFSDAAVDYTVEDLKTLGWSGQDLDQLEQLRADGKIGAEEVELVVDHEEYNGEWNARVKFINRTGGGMVRLKKPMQGDELKRFSARMRDRLRASAGAPRKSASTPAAGNGHPNAPGNGPGATDDIPF